MGGDGYHSFRHGVERVDVPGGWIYFGGPLVSPVLVSDPSQWAQMPATSSSDPRLDRVLSLLQQLREDINTMSGAQTTFDADIADLQAKVAANTSVGQSAITLLNGIPSLIADAVAKAQAAGATDAQLQALTDLSTALAGNTSGLAASVTANTPTPPADTTGGATV